MPWMNPPQTIDEHTVNALYNIGDAMWGIMGALILLSLAVVIHAVLRGRAKNEPASAER